jgi:hypothetical protein
MSKKKNASFRFEVMSVIAGFWKIHTNTLKETVVAIYRGEAVISHKNESLNRNFTVF